MPADQYQVAQTRYNELCAYRDQAESFTTAYEDAGLALDLLLDAQSRQVQAEVDYVRALTEYQQAIGELHFSNGTLVETCGYALAAQKRAQQGPQ